MEKGKERGILKLEPRPRVVTDGRSELTPQGSYERAPSSPQPSVDRLSVTWAEPGMATSLCHLPADAPLSDVRFSPAAGDGSDDEDYSASLSAVLRQRRASVRRSRKGRTRRPSSPFPDETRARRRSSVFTTSSGDTAISIEEPLVVTQEQIFENIHLHKEVLGSVKQQPLGMRRKLKIVHQAKAYIKRHEGQLQERLAQSKSTRDIYARFNILIATKWQQLKREAANTSNLLIPWELRIKEIESHFGSVVASYFTFLRWLFWVNLVIAFILLVFVIVPECLTANPLQDGERKMVLEEERRNASNLLTLWEFEGVLKYSPIFYGYYSNVERPQYRMPLAYFLTGLVVYIYSFVAILRKMAENSRMSKLSEKEDECIFSWKLFTGWDYMIGNTETAHNRIASIILGFKEALLEEAEKKKDLRNWRIISLRALVNICVIILLAVSAYAVVTVVSRSDDNNKERSWWRDNETTIVMTVISITFPVFFDLLGFLEHYHPRKQLRLQLARIMLLNLLNLYSLIFALFSKIEGMGRDLDALKPNLTMNATPSPLSTLNISEALAMNVPMTCYEVKIPCTPCNMLLVLHATEKQSSKEVTTTFLTTIVMPRKQNNNIKSAAVINLFTKQNDTKKYLLPQNLIEREKNKIRDMILENKRQMELLRNLYPSSTAESSSETDEIDTYISGEIDYGSEIISDSTLNIYDEEHSSQTFSTNTVSTAASEATLSTFDDIFSTFTATDMSSSGFESSTEPINTDRVTETPPATSKVQDSTETSLSTSGSFFYSPTTEIDSRYSFFTDDSFSSVSPTDYNALTTLCPNITFNCTFYCVGMNVTQVFVIWNCTIVDNTCYTTQCEVSHLNPNMTTVDYVYVDDNNRRIYTLTNGTKHKLLKLCWETMFGQELVKLTMMDLVFVLLGTLIMDFFRALFVRYMNRCWCWDLEKVYPEYGDFKIAENILHLINNQGMVWMGMFFSPGLVVINVSKLMIMMYLRSWAVMTCNVPHEVVFRVSKSNNFYLALLLTMLFLCVLPVGYSIVWVKPSWHCGPFSEYDRIYYILTSNIYKILPNSLNFALEYIASPAIVIPLLVLLILIIYYLTSLTNSLREANNDLKIQLRRERTEERRKMFQLADTRRRVGSSALDNTPFARWKKALPALPLGKSIDSDDRKTSTGDEVTEPVKTSKKKGGSIFAKIVGLALDKKTDVETVSEVDYVSPSNNGDETDTDFHETLPKDFLKKKDITIVKPENNTEFKVELDELRETTLKVKLEKIDDTLEKDAVIQKQTRERLKDAALKSKFSYEASDLAQNTNSENSAFTKQISESSTQSKQDSIGSVIPVITISTTESDDEILQRKQKKMKEKFKEGGKDVEDKSRSRKVKNTVDVKSLRRQSSTDSTKEQKQKPRGHKDHSF